MRITKFKAKVKAVHYRNVYLTPVPADAIGPDGQPFDSGENVTLAFEKDANATAFKVGDEVILTIEPVPVSASPTPITPAK